MPPAVATNLVAEGRGCNGQKKRTSNSATQPAAASINPLPWAAHRDASAPRHLTRNGVGVSRIPPTSSASACIPSLESRAVISSSPLSSEVYVTSNRPVPRALAFPRVRLAPHLIDIRKFPSLHATGRPSRSSSCTWNSVSWCTTARSSPLPENLVCSADGGASSTSIVNAAPGIRSPCTRTSSSWRQAVSGVYATWHIPAAALSKVNVQETSAVPGTKCAGQIEVKNRCAAATVVSYASTSACTRRMQASVRVARQGHPESCFTSIALLRADTLSVR